MAEGQELERSRLKRVRLGILQDLLVVGNVRWFGWRPSYELL